MAVTLQLTDGTTTVNLANSTGAELQDRYLPVYATPTGDGTIPPDITESIPVYVNVTSDDNLASTLQDIAALQLRAALYANHAAEDAPVWFHRKMDGETGAVRYLVHALTFTPNAQFGGIYDNLCTTDGHLGVITVTHHPYGERTSAVAASGTDSVSVLGGAVNYTDVVGDVPARMYYLALDDTGVVYDRFWFGFRSDARAGGNAGNTATLWECEDGAESIADTGATGDATASPGGGGNTKMQCDFSNTTTWAHRFTIEMSDVTANYANQVGAYVVLARAQVDQDSAQMRLWQHSAERTSYRAGPVVEVDATVWNWYEMGTCEFPGRNLHSIPVGLYAAGYDQSDSLSIEARISTGTPTLDVDCLVLIPCDEYFIECRSAALAPPAANEMLIIAASPEDVVTGVCVDVTNTQFNTLFPVTVIGSGIPVGDGRLFCCAAVTDAGQAGIFSASFDVEVSTYPRWIYARGAE